MLNFDEHLHNIQSKVNIVTGIIRSLQNVLPRPALLTICKSFTRPHLDYGILYIIKHIENLLNQS